MTTPSRPSDIAREALKRLTARKLTPTPDHYLAAYCEVAGISADLVAAGTFPRDPALQRALQCLTKKRPDLKSVLETLDIAINAGHLASIETALEAMVSPEKSATATNPEVTTEGCAQASREMVATAIQAGVVPRLSRFPDLRAEAVRLAEEVQQVRSPAEVEPLLDTLNQFWVKLKLNSDSDAEVQEGLMRMLRLLVGNVGVLLVDDPWMQGQIAVVEGILRNPLDSQVLLDAEAGFRDVLDKQRSLKTGVADARNTIKNMVATFIDSMTEMLDSTGEYQHKIEHYAEELSKTEDIPALNKVLSGLLADTKSIQNDVAQSRAELQIKKNQVTEAESKIRQLESDLEKASELVHEDHLTGALNRRGMSEAFKRELARSDRLGHPLCVALLDIDHFKKLNDNFGHDTGDAALVYLSNEVKTALRPTDVLVRYGGEEFVIILPDTKQEDAVMVMTRLQRQLTKNLFMTGAERLLITFSAGVSLRGPGEPAESLITRADQALYRAKAAGRNCVLPAT